MFGMLECACVCARGWLVLLAMLAVLVVRAVVLVTPYFAHTHLVIHHFPWLASKIDAVNGLQHVAIVDMLDEDVR